MGKSTSAVRSSTSQKIKIVPNYVHKTKLRHHKVATQICPKCKQAIPTTKISEHIKIELLDPKWKEQKAKYMERNKDSNLLYNDDVYKNLKQLAQARPDVFGGDELNLQNKIKERLQNEQVRQKVVWDGHTASIKSIAQKLGSSLEAQSSNYNKGADENSANIQEIGPIVLPKSMSYSSYSSLNNFSIPIHHDLLLDHSNDFRYMDQSYPTQIQMPSQINPNNRQLRTD